MGAFSQFTTSSDATRWPAWFREKWGECVRFPGDDEVGPIASRWGLKTYVEGSGWSGLCEDIHRALFIDPHPKDGPWVGEIFVVFLSVNGEMIRATIARDGVVYEEPDAQMNPIGSLADATGIFG